MVLEQLPAIIIKDLHQLCQHLQEQLDGWFSAPKNLRSPAIYHLCDVDMKKVILLDNETTSSIFANEDYVHDITQAKQQLDLETNGGTLTTIKEATVPGF